MDAMGVDYSCLFRTGMLNVGLHPKKEMEFELCWAYARWVQAPEPASSLSSPSEPETAADIILIYRNTNFVGKMQPCRRLSFCWSSHFQSSRSRKLRTEIVWS
jgi:hypothetical protein